MFVSESKLLSNTGSEASSFLKVMGNTGCRLDATYLELVNYSNNTTDSMKYKTAK